KVLKEILEGKQRPDNNFEINLESTHTTNPTPSTLVSCSVTDNWHEKFGHPGKTKTEMLAKLFPEINIRTAQECDVCLQSKLHQLPYSASDSRATEPLELIHTDVAGPVTPLGLAQERYFILFVDDYSKLIQVYLMRNKNEALDR